VNADHTVVDLNPALAFWAAGAVQALHVPGEFWHLTVAPRPERPGTWTALMHPDPANTQPRDPLWLATGADENAIRICARQWRTSANDLAMRERIRDTTLPQLTPRAAFLPLRLTQATAPPPPSPGTPPGPAPARTRAEAAGRRTGQPADPRTTGRQRHG
jgi:hypothetical protein